MPSTHYSDKTDPNSHLQITSVELPLVAPYIAREISQKIWTLEFICIILPWTSGPQVHMEYILQHAIFFDYMVW